MSAPRKRGDSEGKRVCTVSQRPCSYSADRKRTFRGGETDLIRRFALADQRGRLSCRRGCSMALMECTVISASASSAPARLSRRPPRPALWQGTDAPRPARQGPRLGPLRPRYPPSRPGTFPHPPSHWKTLGEGKGG